MVTIKNKKIDYGDIFIILMFTVLIWSIYMWYYDVFKDYDPPEWGERKDWGNTDYCNRYMTMLNNTDTGEIRDYKLNETTEEVFAESNIISAILCTLEGQARAGVVYNKLEDDKRVYLAGTFLNATSHDEAIERYNSQ